MNEKLSRPQFNQMDTTEKQTLMESLAARYTMTFLDLHTFDRWGQSSTTGIFEKDGRKFVFVPGDTVTLGWEQFAVGLNQESREELEYLFREWEMEPQNPEEMIRESMAPVRQVAIGPMLVGRELEEINWEPVKMDDPRLTAHPDWLKEFRDFAWSDSSSLTLHQSARIERTEDGFQTWIYNRTDYDELLAMLENRGFSLPTADEWAYLCGGGCRTLFPWGDGLDYSMRLRWFEDMDEDENRPYDMEEPNFFGLSIAYDPYMREVVQADRLTTCGGDGGCNICGGLGPFLGFLPCSPHCKPEVQEDNELNGDYDFYRPMLIDTVGMSTLFLPDLQYHFHDMNPNWVVNHAYNVASYILEHDNPIQDGETIDGVADSQMCREVQWKCQYEDSLIQPPRGVLDINMGNYASGGR